MENTAQQPKKETCIDCGETFVITDEEKAWFAKQNFNLPKRCKPCRRVRRQNYGRS